MVKKSKIINKIGFYRHYINDLVQTLGTCYWRHFTDINLNYKLPYFGNPSIKVISQDEIWKIIEIKDCRIYWPAEYSNIGLKGLYIETFAPYNINPHSYMTKSISINKGDWIIDAGACEGFFVHYALKHGANVLAIEPIPRLAEALQMTFRDEIQTGRVIILNAGIGKENGYSNFQIDEKEIYNSTFFDGIGIEIPIITLDEILKQGYLKKIDLIKMDIEGLEIDAILGAREVLSQSPKLALAVYHSFLNAVEIKKIIKKWEPDYKVSFRGIFIRDEYGQPRPYMLHAMR